MLRNSKKIGESRVLSPKNNENRSRNSNLTSEIILLTLFTPFLLLIQILAKSVEAKHSDALVSFRVDCLHLWQVP